MSRPWWQARDPDLARDRETKALGRRDWNWFTAYDGSTLSPADLEPAGLPWSGGTVTVKDRHDRTIGIPARDISMWPNYNNALTPPAPTSAGQAEHQSAVAAARRERAEHIVNQLLTTPSPPSPHDVTALALTQLLDDIAPAVYGRTPIAQQTALSTIARHHDLPIRAALSLARDTGTMIAKTTHAKVPQVPGEAALNRLLHVDRALAAELLLARARLTWAQSQSDPDLPRLWILANGLHHGIDAHTLMNLPATSHGPLARIYPTHDDLIAWTGVTTALTQLQATITAAGEGRAWLQSTHLHFGSIADRTLALGVLHLTHPRTAHELAATSITALTIDQVKEPLARLPPPGCLADLSDAALKAVCDRNHWLNGTTDERTHRELIERNADTAIGEVRRRLADGDISALAEAVTRYAPSDEHLDQAVWRHDPPNPETIQRQQLLHRASRLALHQLAGLTISPHPTRAAALSARFPQRLAERGLTATTEQILTEEAHLLPHRPFFGAQGQLDLDF